MLVVFIVCTCKYRVCGLEKIASVENERVEEIWQFSLNLHIAIVFVLMENLEMSGNLKAVRKKNLVREQLTKSVYCKLHICVHTGVLVGVCCVMVSDHALLHSYPHH